MTSKRPATGSMPSGLKEIGDLFGLPIELKTPTERKEEIISTTGGAMQDLRSVLSRDPVGSEELDRIYPQSTERLNKRLDYLLKGLERMSRNAQQLLSNTQLSEERRATVQAAMDLLSLSKAEVSWRARAIEHWGLIIEMDVVVKKCKLVKPQTGHMTDRPDKWVGVEFRHSRKYGSDLYAKNKDSLLASLQANDIKQKGIPRFVTADLKLAGNVLEQHRSAEIVSVFMADAELETFLDTTGTSAGLLVLGSNLQTYREARTILSGLAAECTRRLSEKKGALVLKHFAGLRVQDTQHLRQYSGVAGLLRSMCHQLVVTAGLNLTLEFIDAWSADDMSAVCEGDIPMLCRLFRHLLLDLAGGKIKKNNRHTVFLIVDSIHVLELDEHRADFYRAVDFLRELCDEATLGDLGDGLKFQYIFLHNGVSKLILKPHPRERIVFPETLGSKEPES